jgi:23S rRNA G2445 N2-methylase RlmL
MHFGLYAFELFEVIYAEAWERNVGTLRADYPEREAFHRDVPRLILENNIYGVDIDPRAVQIARLALWLRAQKAWQQLRVAAVDRPQIRKSHVVCAEPMPGNRQLLDDFISAHLAGTPENEILAKLLRRIVESMELAGEAGVLLRIEGAIADAVKQEKGRDQAVVQKALPGLGVDGSITSQDALPGFSLGRVADGSFWASAEARLYAELARYSARLEQGGLQRRMFAEDAAQGFAFIDLCRERFDIVVMNPPFGEWSVGFKKQSKDLYPNSYCDILAAFVERGGELLHPGGRLGAITSRTCFFLSSYTKWREEVVLKAFEPKLLVDLGHGVMDEAMVEAAAYVFLKPHA